MQQCAVKRFVYAIAKNQTNEWLRFGFQDHFFLGLINDKEIYYNNRAERDFVGFVS